MLYPPDRPLTPDDIRAVAAEWRHARHAYPGWEIAPKRSRDSLGRDTRRWTEPLLGGLDNLPPSARLAPLFELIWRLQVSLSPLMLDWVDRIRGVLDITDPFAQSSTGDSTRGKDGHRSSLETVSQTDMWLEVACALATEARDDQDEERFSSWMTRLTSLGPLSGHWQVRLAHERCLWAPYRLDSDLARDALSRWPTAGAQFPMWETRRAAMLAELGDVVEAEKIAEAALSTLTESRVIQ